MKFLELFKSDLNIFQRIAGVCRTLREDGWGRTLLRVNRKYRFITYRQMRTIIKFFRVMGHPLDYSRRRLMAKKIAQHSIYRDMLPQKTGYRLLTPEEIPFAQKAIENCREFLNKKAAFLKENENNGKEIYLYLLIENQGHNITMKKADVYNLQQIPGLTELVLSPALLETATCYLGEVPILAGVTIYASLPNSTLGGSQLFHLDKGDFRQVKFIFAIADVTEESGPFTFIPADKGAIAEKKLGETSYGRVSDADIYGIVGEDAAVRCIGDSGSAVIVDTGRCFHYGSRNITKTRCLLQVQYLSRCSIGEPLFYLSQGRIEKLNNLTKLQKMALSHINVITERPTVLSEECRLG